MDPVTIGAVAVPAIGSLIGKLFSSGDTEAANELIKQQLENISNIKEPEQRALAFEELKSVGVLSPEMEQAYLQSDTELKNMKLDPQYREIEMAALDKLGEISEQGLTPTDKARLADIEQQALTTARGQREAATQNAASRGIAGSGLELAMSRQADQDAAQRMNKQGLTIAADAEQRALDALMNQTNLAGQMQSTEFNQQAQIAAAQDAINKYNTSARQDVANANVQAINKAKEYNLTNQQNIANQNVGLRNQATAYNQEADQRAYENALKKQQLSNQAAGAQASNLQQNAQSTQNMWSGIGQAAGTGLSKYAEYQNTAKKTETNEAKRKRLQEELAALGE